MAAAVGGFRTGRGGAPPTGGGETRSSLRPAASSRGCAHGRAVASGVKGWGKRLAALPHPGNHRSIRSPDRPVDRCAMPAASDWRAPDRRAEPERQGASAWATRSPFAVSEMSDVPVCSPERRQAVSPWRITTTSPAESAWIVMDGWPARRSVACSLIPTPPDAGHGGDGPGRG